MPNGAYRFVLVEQGPWESADAFVQLKRLEGRLYDTVDVAVDGRLIDRFPDLRGRHVTIRVDCYDTLRDETRRLVEVFADHIAASAEIQESIRSKGFVAGLSFDYSWQSLK